MGTVDYIDVTINYVNSSADASGSADIKRECVIAREESSERTKCPAGTKNILDKLKAKLDVILGNTTGSTGGDSWDGHYRVPVKTQGVNTQNISKSISYGSLAAGEPTVEKFDETIFLSVENYLANEDDYIISLDESLLKWKPDKILSAIVIGDAYDNNGDVVSAYCTIDGFDLVFNIASYCQVAVSYNATTTDDDVDIPPTDDGGRRRSSLIIKSECGDLQRVRIAVPICIPDDDEDEGEDEDGDGIPDDEEGTPGDEDGDGIPDSQDAGSTETGKDVKGADALKIIELCTGKVTVIIQ